MTRYLSAIDPVPLTTRTAATFPGEQYVVAADAFDALSDKYNELLMAVATKVPGESRHDTALRYIRQAEAARDDQCTADSRDASQ